MSQSAIPHLIVVHVIEARGLTGVDSSGTSDAVCNVELGPVTSRRQSTSNQPETNNALWEKSFIFDGVWLTESQFNTEKLALKVFDRNTLMRNVLIGAVEITLSFVYRKKSRALHRVWMPLHLPTDPQAVRGQLLLSVYVLRPGDPTPTFGPGTQGESGSTLQVPATTHKPFQLNVLIYRGENILAHRDQRVNSFISIRFNGNTVRTSTRSNQRNPVFNRRFEMPFYIPVTSDSIEIMLWHEVRGGPDQLIASMMFPQNELTYKPWGPKWVSLYTMPQSSQGFIGSLLDHISSDRIAESEYAGRVLVRLSVSSVKKTKLLSVPLDTISDEPSILPYIIKFQLYSAGDLPVNGGQVMVELIFGGTRLRSPQVSGSNGEFKWNCNFRSIKEAMPADLEQVPDIIISLYHKIGLTNNKIAYLRLRARDLLNANLDWAVNADTEGVNSWQPQWRPLQLARSNGDSIVAGFLLFTIAMGIPTTAFDRQCLYPMIRSHPQRFTLRCQLLLAANLPCATDDSLSNPLCVVRLAGAVVQTRTCQETCYPLWMQDLYLDVSLDAQLAPNIVVLIYHESGASLMKQRSFLARTELQVPFPLIVGRPQVRSVADGDEGFTKEGKDEAGARSITRYPLYWSEAPNYARRDSFLCAQFTLMTVKEAQLARTQPFIPDDLMKSEARTIQMQMYGVRCMFGASLANLVNPSIQISVPNLAPGTPQQLLIKTLGPDRVGSLSTGSTKMDRTVRFDSIQVSIESLDCFAILVRVFDHRTTGLTPIAHRYIQLHKISCDFVEGSLKLCKFVPVDPWYSPPHDYCGATSRSAIAAPQPSSANGSQSVASLDTSLRPRRSEGLWCVARAV